MATKECAVCGAIIGSSLSIVALVFGILACVPGSPFEERDTGICVSFIVLSVCGIITIALSCVGACIGACIDAAVEEAIIDA